jgi:pyrroline-5-carboxylate reductase
MRKKVFLEKVATKGGVNEAALDVLKGGKSVNEALFAAVERSKKLAGQPL